MKYLIGNELKAADLILQYGKYPVYLSVLYGKGLNTLSGLDIAEIETAGQFLKTIGFVQIITTEMGITYNLTDEGYDFVKSGRLIRDKITEIESETAKSQADLLDNMKIDEQDKDLSRRSSFAQIQSKIYAQWAVILGALAILVSIWLAFKK